MPIAFSENPRRLGLPSIHTGDWDPLLAACEETDTVVNMHIGSSSTFPKTIARRAAAVIMALTFEGAAHALVDWLTSGVLARFSALRIALSARARWAGCRSCSNGSTRPGTTARCTATSTKAARAAQQYIPGRVFGCVFDDLVGLRLRDRIGMSQIMFETDYPHGDSTFPHSRADVEKIVAEAGLSRAGDLAARARQRHRCYGLDRFGITA